MNTASASLLSTVRASLAARYNEDLGQTLRDNQPVSIGDPVWRLVDVADLRSPCRVTEADVAGVLLDQELGLVLFVIPYDKGADLQAQVIVASSLQSSLHPLVPAILPSDEFGPWQVAIHWLVEESARESWETQMVQLRQHTGFSEELVFDAVFYEAGELERRLTEQGLPRLLFTARHVLRQASHSDAANWINADTAVLRELEDLAAQFTEPEQRRRANLIQEKLGEIVLETQAESTPFTSRELNSIEVRDFRNLGHIRWHFGLSPVSCRVIHGPNGTGKTSLFEALCLALCHSSRRYRAFLSREDRDIVGADRRRVYSEQYLAPFGEGHRSPRIGLNGREPTPPELVPSWEDANRLDLEFSGNLLAQDTSQDFVQLSSDDLAVRVLAGYSELAERLEGFVEQQVEKAAQRRQEFLRNLGLNASITRIDTALSRIAQQILQRELPQPSPSLLAWLDRLSQVPQLAGDVSALRSNWQQWSDDSAQAGLAEKLALSEESVALLTMENWIVHENRLALQTRELTQRIDALLAPIREHAQETIRDLTVWGEWLERHARPMAQPSPPPSEVEPLHRQLAEIQAAQQKAMKDGQATRQHLEHLEQVITSIKQGLTAREPNQCPTCGANHSGGGGIARVVARLRDEVAARRESLRCEYRALEEKIKAIQRTLQSRGEVPCPLSEERRAYLQETLRWLLPSPGAPLEIQLSKPPTRGPLLDLLQTVQTRPPSLPEVDPGDEAQRIVREISRETSEARDHFFDQDHWGPVQTLFRKKLARVVTEHLPETLERLWNELTMNLTSAPWLLPARPGFDVVLKRGQRRATVRVGNRLARYILNQAETHLLGLGWFFTRYLTHGRFRSHVLAMDDPAQQLDETSYRDLCRLWRVLVRLHTIRKLPLRLLLFLHQEDRALDAARATRGSVELLSWAPEQDGELRILEMFAPSSKPSHPDVWFRHEQVSA